MCTARPQPCTTPLRRSPRHLLPEPAATTKSKNKMRTRKNPERKKSSKIRTGLKGLANPATGQRRSSRLREGVKKSVAAIETEIRGRSCVLGLAAADAKAARQNRSFQSNKRDISECGLGDGTGWSKEQEAALQRAYLVAKPTPHFWKKVSRMIPGKSAQDCFDKVHSDLSTPPRRLRSRAKKTDPTRHSPSPISASKVLNPVKTVTKSSRSTKQKTHQAQKTVRHLLQKQYHAEQDNEADLFSVLEPNVDPSSKLFESCGMFSTPENLRKSHSSLHKFWEKPSLSNKKAKSRFHGLNVPADLVSPPVLKSVKNRALHEKFLDQLHTRDAQRNRVLSGKNVSKENECRRVDVVRTAKSALICDVKNAIDQLRNLQDATESDSMDLCDDFDDGDGEGDDVLG